MFHMYFLLQSSRRSTWGTPGLSLLSRTNRVTVRDCLTQPPPTPGSSQTSSSGMKCSIPMAVGFLLCFQSTSPMLLLAVSLFPSYRFSAPALRWSKKIPPSNIKTDYQHHCPRKVPSISTQIQHDSVIFYILGSFSQDTHNNLEPAPQGLILSICFHCSLRRLLLCLHVNMHLVFSLKTTSPVMGWNGIGSTVGKWKEKSGPYRLRKSSLHSPKWYQRYNKECSNINLIQSFFTLASWREEWHI